MRTENGRAVYQARYEGRNGARIRYEDVPEYQVEECERIAAAVVNRLVASGWLPDNDRALLQKDLDESKHQLEILRETLAHVRR